MIGIYCLAYPFLSDQFSSLFFSAASSLNVESNNILFIIVRLIISSLLLITPTFAMGGTLPVLSKHFINKIENSQSKIGWLYFINSFGAVFGVILAGFMLIKTYGLDTTIYSAAIVNITLGLIALLLSKFTQLEESKIADEIKTLGVRANADTPADAKKALEFGAEGVGLCRTEHMFMDKERLPIVQNMIIARTMEERQDALNKIFLPY